MSTLEYNGYRGSVEFSQEDRVLHGRLLGIEDVISFEGGNVDELERAFREAVDDYLRFCEEIGKKPERAYSGRIPLRIGPELHRSLAALADASGCSLNAWLAHELTKVADATHRPGGSSRSFAMMRAQGHLSKAVQGNTGKKVARATGKILSKKSPTKTQNATAASARSKKSTPKSRRKGSK